MAAPLRNLVHHTAHLVRAIELRPTERPGMWEGYYPGDLWTGAFRTEAGPRWMVRDVLLQSDLRRGLPIVDAGGLATPRLSAQAIGSVA